MFRNAVAGHERHIFIRQRESGLAAQLGGGTLDDPHPKAFAADAGAIQIEQHGLYRVIEFDRMYGIICWIAQRGVDKGQRVLGKRDEFDFAIGGGEDGFNAAPANLMQAIAARLQGNQARIMRKIA